ncbi:MAG TPA: outer membrane beta-barrel protein [Gemmatimonadales bacterium]|nr:outer membrane beta-barrel protein [Gemmatimonadales bacterium]
MRGLTKVVAALTVGTLVSAPVLHAQGTEFSLGGGVGVPLGTFDNTVKTGWHGLAAISFVPNGSPVGIQFDGQYQQYKLDGSASLKDRFIMGTGNIVFKFNSSEGATFRPYLIGGGGVYNFKTTGTNDLGTIVSTDNSTTKFGLNAGAGFDFKLGSVGLFLESRFHDVFTSGEDLKFVPITLGLRFGGS